MKTKKVKYPEDQLYYLGLVYRADAISQILESYTVFGEENAKIKRLWGRMQKDAIEIQHVAEKASGLVIVDDEGNEV